MLILGIILLIVGAAVGYAVPHYGPAGYGGWGYGPGAILFVIGLVLILLAILGIPL